MIAGLATADDLADAVTLYASFDEQVKADRGGGSLEVRTRFDHPTEKGEYVFQDGYDADAFGIAEKGGVAGGALECRDVLPRRGRMFFAAKDNLAYREGGWGGAASMWLNTDPNKLLKTPFCDPVQITHQGAHNGGLWIDFPDKKPRDMRLGVFRGLDEGEQPLKEDDPAAAIVRLERIPFEEGDWHHVAISWRNFDTGKADAAAQLYVDGKLAGKLTGRELAMQWQIEKTGIYFAVNFIGRLDEFAVFSRPLTAAEIKTLHENPAYLNDRRN